MPKKVIKGKKSKKEDLKEEFRKMLIASIMKDMKKKKVKECTTCLKVSSRKSTSNCKPKKSITKKKVTKKKVIVGGDDFQSEPFVPYKGTKKVEGSKIYSKKSKAMVGGEEGSKIYSKKSKAMVGGDNFVKDLQKAGQGLGLSMEHTFQSMSNLGKDMYCESDAIMNIGRELDLGYAKDCPFTTTKSWDYNKIKQ